MPNLKFQIIVYIGLWEEAHEAEQGEHANSTHKGPSQHGIQTKNLLRVSANHCTITAQYGAVYNLNCLI